jgi:hypothetical protein
MEQFNISNVIEHYKLNTEDLAKVLFPTVKYPKQAFDRVLKGEANLDIMQVERLASHIGVLVTDLFSVNTWKGSSEDGCLVMLKGEYKVKLNYNGVYVSIYKNNNLICQNISNVPSMTVQEFINYIDNFIKNYENGNN